MMVRTKNKLKRTIIPRKKSGPKGFWSNSMLTQVFELARFGMTDEEIAGFYKLSVSTINNWKRNKPEFNRALQEGRVISSLGLVDSVYKRAHGYDHTEVHCEYLVNEKGQQMLVSKKVIKKHIHANITAAIFLLKARHGDKWSVEFVTRLSGSIDINGNTQRPDLTGFTKFEKKLLKKYGLKQLKAIHDRPSDN